MVVPVGRDRNGRGGARERIALVAATSSSKEFSASK